MKTPRISAIALAAALAFTLLPQAFAAVQEQWRYCRKCHVMFYDGYPNKGRCAAGGGHVAATVAIGRARVACWGHG